MLLIERLFRRIAYSFGVALIVTAGFIGIDAQFYVPAITWIVTGLIFISSWRIQKEYTTIIEKLDGPNAEASDPIAFIVRDKPHIYHLIWSAIYTFGTYIVVMLPLDWFVEGTRSWRPVFIVVAAVIFLMARIGDARVRPSFYNKKS